MPPRERIKVLFDRAMELPVADREPFVRAEAGGDRSLIAEVMALLAHADEGTTRTGPIREDRPSGLPDRIGHYHILGVLGEGGFGVVYEAEQTQPVKRRVAVKVIKAGMDSASVVSRFEAERQALAVMDHPCVAKIYDGGLTEPEHGGRPYFAMELVRGEPITDYCDKNRLSIEARVGLFKQVCEAVQHAHTKGVIHRDLKPSNILVAHTEHGPAPKVIDFGVAKAINQRLTEATIFTEQGQMIGTPEYMSPEQAEMSGTDIDTRSDIYSLGVILYELLSGRRPFESAQLRQAGLAEIQRIIREDDPPRPSTRVSTAITADADLASKMAKARQSEPRQLEKRLRGELDWVVMKCLAKERDRRYESANGLAAELGRYLDGDVVQARPPSRVYRTRKFARKNRAASVSVLAIGAVLVAAAGVSLSFAFEAESQRGKAELALVDRDLALANETEQREIAEAAQTEAMARADELEQVAQFQQEQLGGVDAARMGLAIREGLGEKLKAISDRRGLETKETELLLAEYESLVAGSDFTGLALETLDAEIFQPAISAIEKQFANQQLVKARLLQTIANTMREAGLLEQATGPQLESLTIRRRELDSEHPDTLKSVVYTGDLLNTQGKWSEAEPFYIEALETGRLVFGESDRFILQTRSHYGELLKNLDRYEEAESALQEVVSESELILGPLDPITLVAMNKLADFFERVGKNTDAEPLYRKILEGKQSAFGRDHPSTLVSVNDLGVLLLKTGQLTEAEGYLQRAFDGFRASKGDDHHNTLAARNNLGDVLRGQGRLTEAETQYLEALRGKRRVLGSDHPSTLKSLNNIGLLYQSLEEYSLAETYFEEFLRTAEMTLGPDHIGTLTAMSNLAALHEEQGRFDDAKKLMTVDLDRRREVFGDAHPATLRSKQSLAGLYYSEGLLEQADALSTEAVSQYRSSGTSPEIPRLLAIGELGLIRGERGKYIEAESLLVEAYDGLSRDLGDHHENSRHVATDILRLYTVWHAAEPGAGHDLQAAEWRAKLEPQPELPADPVPAGG